MNGDTQPTKNQFLLRSGNAILITLPFLAILCPPFHWWPILPSRKIADGIDGQ